MLPEPGTTIYGEREGYNFDELYRIGDRLGSGSYGDVFKCHHKSYPDVAYAVKKLDKQRLQEKSNNNVAREISILRELANVPHVVTLVDLFQDVSTIYMVQILAAGGDVFDRLGKRKAYTEKDARDLASILLSTIAAIHQVPIVHRDLKPENLLLQSPFDDTSILLADFGFARYIQPNEMCQTRCGTPAFVAPEILLGIPYGISADLWSIGCLLYMLIAGYPPFTGQNHRELFCKVRAGDFVFHDTAFGGVSTAAKTLIANLLTVSVDSRWSANEALGSRWFKMQDKELQSNDLSSRALQGFKSFSAKKKWKVAKTAIVWAANQRFWKPDNVTFNQQLSAWDKQFIKGQLGQDVTMSDANGAGQNSASRAPPTRMLTAQGSVRIPAAPLQSIDVQGVKFSNVYKVQKVLRSGSAAQVCTCTHVHTNETYAVKMIDRRRLSPADDENVLNEVAAMQSLSGNKYCVQLLDFYEEPHCFYLVMEYMAGGDVFERIVNLKAYTEEDARNLSVDLLSAIRSIHAKGIAHRDIKPQNLLLANAQDHSSIKVADFGFSRRVHTPESLTSRVGTPTYVAPEILKNIPHDERADLWSVGVVIFVLLVGYPPFLEEDQAVLFDKIRMGQWAFVEDDWRHISDDAKALIYGLLRVDPKDRWSVDQALRCKWIHQEGHALSSISLQESVSSIRTKRTRLRALARPAMWNANGAVSQKFATQAHPMDLLDEELDSADLAGLSSALDFSMSMDDL